MKLNLPTLTDHRSKFAKRGKREMCSFGSCQTRFEFLSQFRKVRNAFECFVAQVQTYLPKIKCVWPMKITVICTVADLERKIHENWAMIGRRTCLDLIRSMTRRIQECIDARGGHTRY